MSGDTLPDTAEVMLNRRRVSARFTKPIVLPRWAVDQIVKLESELHAGIDRAILASDRLKNVSVPVNWVEPGRVLEKMLSAPGMAAGYDLVLLVSNLGRGGASLAAIHHANTAVRAFNLKTLVVSTDGSAQEWRSRLINEVDYFDFNDCSLALRADFQEHEVVLSRFLLQLSPAAIHVINSRLGWQILERHGESISHKSSVFASLFADEIDVDGKPAGFASEFLPSTAKYVDTIFTDNQKSASIWIARYNLEGRVGVAHFPAPPVHERVPFNRQSKRVLWASRIAREKNLELLLSLIKEDASIIWDIYGTPDASTQSSDFLARARKEPNAKVHGVFGSLAGLITQDHVAFVYTSLWDGMPNVVLEAASEGLPVIASDVGGISDLLPLSDLIPPTGDVARRYIDAIHSIYSDSDERTARIRRQDANLKSFSQNAFEQSIERNTGLKRTPKDGRSP